MEKVIVLAALGMVLTVFGMCLFVYLAHWTHTKSGIAHDEGRAEGFKEGYRTGVTNSWTHVMVTGKGVKLWINGRPVEPKAATSPTVNGFGVWYHDGHFRDWFLARGDFEEEQLAHVYHRDQDKLTRRLGLDDS